MNEHAKKLGLVALTIANQHDGDGRRIFVRPGAIRLLYEQPGPGYFQTTLELGGRDGDSVHVLETVGEVLRRMAAVELKP